MNTREAESLLGAIGKVKVAVVGDFMLDRYVWGSASRISPEAPVPVVAVDRETSEPGGAANVLRTLSTLGVSAYPFGVVGEDAAGETLREIAGGFSADVSGLTSVKGRPTTQKTRVLAGNQQVVRIDRELAVELGDGERDELLRRIELAVAEHDVGAIIVEDYAKGVVNQALLSRLADMAGRRGLVLSLDPHPAHPFGMAGLSVITPNRAEAFAMAGAYFSEHRGPFEEDAALFAVAEILEERWQPQCVLITLGANGMALFKQGKPALHVPTRAREVFDVSGAGDTVIAVFTAALAAGASAEDAAVLANHAAGVVVAKVGTAPVYADEILVTFDE